MPGQFDGLVQERRENNSIAMQWSYIFLALTHRSHNGAHTASLQDTLKDISDPNKFVTFM